MLHPKISVIIPAYNAEDYIENSINSALCQTFTDLEVIVVDDGSDDRTSELVDQIEDPRVRLIQQKNLGQSAAINKGYEISQGTYIKLLDADDWINPEHLESQIEAIEGMECTLASCKWGYFVDDCERPNVSNEFVNVDYDSPLEWLFDSLTKDEGMMGGWLWLIPRSLWEKAGGFEPRLNLNNDFHFSIKLLLASESVRFAKNAVYSYRKGLPGALSNTSDERAMESAYLTTELGVQLLLTRENSPRIRKICADRLQQWLFQFYPAYPELVAKTERRIRELGGSDKELQGGLLLKILKPVLGWKGVRRAQAIAYRSGWQTVLRTKNKSRLNGLN